MKYSKYHAHDQKMTNGIKISKNIKKSWLGKLYEKRKQQNRDLVIIVTDSNAERGTGKTTLSLILAQLFDINEFTKENCTNDVNKAVNKYVELPKKSSIVFDEIGVMASKYRQTSSVNRALNNIMSLGRIHQKYIIFNAPSKAEIDNEIEKKADVWVNVLRRGAAKVHAIRWEPHNEKTLHPTKIDKLTWEPIDPVNDTKLQEAYEFLAEQKDKAIRNNGKEKIMNNKDVEKKVKRAKEEASRESRNEIIKNLYDNLEVSQRDIANIMDLSKSTVNNIINS